MATEKISESSTKKRGLVLTIRSALSAIGFFIGMTALGAMLWTIFPDAIGVQNYADVPGYYLLVLLILFGFFAGFVMPNSFWVWPIALFTGQLLGVILSVYLGVGTERIADLLTIITAIVAYTIPAFGTSIAGALVRSKIDTRVTVSTTQLVEFIEKNFRTKKNFTSRTSSSSHRFSDKPEHPHHESANDTNGDGDGG